MYNCILCNLNFKRNHDFNRHINSKRHLKTISDTIPEKELNIIIEDERDTDNNEETNYESLLNPIKIPIINKNLTISTDSLKSVNLEKIRNKTIKQEEKEKKKLEIKEEKEKKKLEIKEEKIRNKTIKKEEIKLGINEKINEEIKELKEENQEETNNESGIQCHCSVCDKTYMKKKYYDKHLLSKVHIKNYKLKYKDVDERIPVINTKTGLVKYGKNAPLKIKLETFLYKYPDYKIYTKYSTNNALLTIKKELIKLIKVIDIQLKY